MTLEQLTQQITEAQTSKQLQEIVDSIPLQSNGMRRPIARHLENCFWYIEMHQKVDQQIKWMLKVVKSYQTI